ncbi:5047_t:CDS:2 [Cetraspora pellucida]|uniref:5047_t:CDS:1 n=1 Tax=Cetraspora pellucida TaxID=1433469 RepID=A0A9N9IIH3_9GLOM|nr:5047_t:CDS:2 [Cetraspora pellucida]
MTLPLLLANDMWIGSTPACLQDLSIPEQLFISPEYPCINLIQITKRKHTYYKLREHIMTLPQNPSSLINLKKVLQVQKSKITIALKWLFDHNKLFKSKIKLDKNILNNLPKGEIPKDLTVITIVIDIDSHETEHYTNYTCDQQESNSKSDDDEIEEMSNINKYNLKDFISNNSINSTNELRPSEIINVDDIPIIRKELTLLSFKKLVDNLDYNTYEQLSSNKNMPKLKDKAIQSHILNVPHGNKSLNEYEDLTLFLAGFLVLFPYGVSDDESRLSRVSLKKYTNHLINPAVNELLKNIKSADSTLSLFITINPANLYSSFVMIYARKEIDLQNLFPGNFPKASERAQLIHLNPIAVAKYFHVIIQAIIDTLIGYKRKNNDSCVPGYDAIDELELSDNDDNLAINNAPDNTIL